MLFRNIFLFGVCICALFNFHVFAQKNVFEGSIIYLNKEIDERGKPRMAPVDKEKIFFAKNVILTRTISGPQMFILGNIDIYLNVEKKLKYSINHDNSLIKRISDLEIEKIISIEEKLMKDEIVLGYNCDVNFLKYVHQFDGPYGRVYDTLSCTYYNSKEFKIPHLDIFGLLQGNKNTLFLDGRYDGVPLKVILKKNDGSIIMTESVEVKQMNVDKFVKLPNYLYQE